MARIPNTASKAERVELHKAKMEGKRYDRARRAGQRTGIASMNQLRKLVGTTSLAGQVNRHTGQPHENLRERKRFKRQQDALYTADYC